MTGPGEPRIQRISMTRVMGLAERLAERDWQILGTVNRLRLASGAQLERLHFQELTGRSRAVVRWRVLKRLVDAQVLMPLTRRVGGSLRGSAQLVYAVDVAGERLLRLRRNLRQADERIRRPGAVGERFVAHTLATSELYVELVERSRNIRFSVDEYLAEPAAWWPNGAGGWMKPDAYLAVSLGDVADHWWVEVDLATEAMPTLHGKFLAYLDFVRQGHTGPADVVPRVLVTVPSEARYKVVAGLTSKLPAPAAELFVVARHVDAAALIATELGNAGGDADG